MKLLHTLIGISLLPIFVFSAVLSKSEKDSLRAEELIKTSIGTKDFNQFKKDLSKIYPKNSRKDLVAFFCSKYCIYTRQLEKGKDLVLNSIKQFPKGDLRTAKLHNSLGNIQTYLNQIPEGISSFNTAIAIYEKHNLRNKTGTIHSNIGNIYFMQLDYFSAEKKFEKAVNILRKDKDTVFLGGINALYAMCLAKLNDNSKAEKELSLAYSISQKYQNKIGITCCLLARGEIFQSEKKYEKAEEAFLKSLKFAEQNGMAAFIIFNHVSLNKLYNIQGRFQEAVVHGEMAVPMIKSSNNASPLASAYRNLSISYAGIQEYKKAYDFNQLALNLFRQINSERNKKIINELNIKYETAQKEKALALNDAKLNRLSIVALTIGFLLFLSILMYYLSRKKTKERLSRLEEQKKLDLIAANLVGEEREKERVSYELHDSISASITALRMKIENLEIPESNLNSITANLSSLQSETRKISHNLLPFQGGIENFIPTIKSYCLENSTDNFHINFHSSLKVLPLSETKAKTLYRVIQELVNNAMRHSQSKLCFVSINQENGRANVLVEDEGVGIENSAKKGQGISSIIQRIQQMQGLIEINAKVNKGTSIFIEIPIDSQ